MQNWDYDYIRDLIAFLINGTLNNFPYVVMLSAAQAILPEQIGGVLLCNVLPSVLVKLVSPFFMHYIPYTIRIICIFLCSFLSFYIVALGINPAMKLFGVVIAAIGAGLGEITFLAMISYYNKNCVSTWSIGTGIAGLTGSLSYLLLVSVFKLTPTTSLIIVSLLPPFLLVSNFIILSGKHNKGRKYFGLIKDKNYKDFEIPSKKNGEEYFEYPDSENSGLIHTSDQKEEPPLTLLERIYCIFPLLQYMIPLFVVFYSEYVINTGIAPTILFHNNSYIDAIDDYKYYTFIYSLGVFISRSSVNILPIKYTIGLWIMAFTQFFLMILFFLDAYFRIVPNIYIIFAVIFFEGLLGGACYVNAFLQIQIKMPPRVREFSMGLTSVADSTGIAFSALTAIFVQPWLKNNQRRII